MLSLPEKQRYKPGVMGARAPMSRALTFSARFTSALVFFRKSLGVIALTLSVFHVFI